MIGSQMIHDDVPSTLFNEDVRPLNGLVGRRDTLDFTKEPNRTACTASPKALSSKHRTVSAKPRPTNFWIAECTFWLSNDRLSYSMLWFTPSGLAVLFKLAAAHQSLIKTQQLR